MDIIGTTIWLCGGSISAVQYSDEVHKFSLTSPGWEVSVRVEGEKIPQIAGHSFTAVRDKLFMFGGRNAIQTSNDLYEFDTGINKWKLIRSLKEKRCYHTSTLLSDKNSIMIFGGSSNKGRDGFLNSIEIIDGSSGNYTSIQSLSQEPEPRMQHAATLANDDVYIWGGKGEDGTIFNDLHIFNTKQRKWSSPSITGTKPPGRYGHTLTYHDGKLFVFGGLDDKKRPSNSLFILNISTMTWKESVFDQVPPLHGHSAFVYKDELYFLGWEGQFQFLVLDTSVLGASIPENKPAWVPEGETHRAKTKIVASRESQILPDSSKLKSSSMRQINKKTVLERIEKLEYFSDSLTNSVIGLINCKYYYSISFNL